jgi:hypothetical protein
MSKAQPVAQRKQRAMTHLISEHAPRDRHVSRTSEHNIKIAAIRIAIRQYRLAKTGDCSLAIITKSRRKLVPASVPGISLRRSVVA